MNDANITTTRGRTFISHKAFKKLDLHREIFAAHKAINYDGDPHGGILVTHEIITTVGSSTKNRCCLKDN